MQAELNTFDHLLEISIAKKIAFMVPTSNQTPYFKVFGDYNIFEQVLHEYHERNVKGL